MACTRAKYRGSHGGTKLWHILREGSVRGCSRGFSLGCHLCLFEEGLELREHVHYTYFKETIANLLNKCLRLHHLEDI